MKPFKLKQLCGGGWKEIGLFVLLVAVGFLIQLFLIAPFWKEDKGEVGYSFISVVLLF